MSATCFSYAERQKMACIMDLNGYEQDGESLRFVILRSGEVLEFKDWSQVFDFIRERFTKSKSG